MTDLTRPPIAPPPPQAQIPPPPPPPKGTAARDVATSATQRAPSQTLQQAPAGINRNSAAPPPPPPPKAGAAAATMVSRVPNRGPVPSPGQPTLASLVTEAHKKGFSDIHVGVGEIPRFRNRGEMELTDYPLTDEATFMSWLREVLTDEEIRRFQDNLEFDGATQYDFARVRINVFDSLTGSAMVMRLIPLKILTLEDLRLPAVLRDICHYHKGLILVTGPTGSGKSTTMAAMVDYINKEMPKHIITIEDPIEFVHKSRKSLIKQREVGIHTLQFDKALKASLREDPDLILVGEMRDKETVNTALKAAQTGHLVMGTLHTNSAVKTIERILNLYNADEQHAMRIAIAESLVAVIAQGLCRTTDGKRAAFHDILVNTETVKDYIRQGKNDEIVELMSEGDFDGMITMNKALLQLYQEGRITEETALEMSPTPNEMAQFLRGRL
ncbi:MAG: type IV pilus twitching motility protein PilT [Kastovskya adunca ATA6-11-RM4]|nr:type IV pilus twitching motility protein PilT [Kastovskya adunca ATA6-11-RM4]